MRQRIRPGRALVGVCLLALLLFCSACNGGSNQSAQPTLTRPANGKQLLNGKALTYVALGASDAVGVGSTDPETQGYAPRIAQHLPRGSHFINLGVSGSTLHKALANELPLALSTSPELITIWLVANDFVDGVTYESYMNDLHMLLDQLQTGTHARIVLANLPDLTLLPSFGGRTPAQKASILQEIKRWNAGITHEAARYHDPVVDLFAEQSELTAHPEFVSGDGFHPSSSGYAVLANKFWTAIQQ
ncbi:GDSL-type esterase/lipase family protein [Ktedonobacter sp. SOSP1-52]|uniref:SGNH/GDSL hydrolase family protein n=1 Tax=Ktedonobacter sp. SOSP1-52 TaxID=2778366 RepID=UPI001915DCA0|nr:GDSL-type esterase/lipase family protein [Ktedonobacter sp. SOSP1-52]